MHITSLGIIHGLAPSLAIFTTVAPRVTTNTMLNKTMGDLYRETERWIERVKTCGYMYSLMWECQWDKICKTDIEVMGHVDSYSLAAVLNPRDALYGGCYETVALHDQSTNRSVINYMDVHSLYPTSVRANTIP